MIFMTKANHHSNEKGRTIPALSGQIPFGRNREFVIPSFNIINTHKRYEIICNTCVSARQPLIMIYPKPCNTSMQYQLNATRNKMGKHYSHIDLVIIIQLTCNTHLCLNEIFLFGSFRKYVLYTLNNVTLTFKPYMFTDTKINALPH
jgi:hypothetical protein